MKSPNDIKKQFSQGLFSRIEKLTCAFASPKSHSGSRRAKENTSKPTAAYSKIKNAPETFNRAKTPQPNAGPNRSASRANDSQKVNVKELNNRLYYEYLKFQRDKSSMDHYCTKPIIPSMKTRPFQYSQITYNTHTKPSTTSVMIQQPTESVNRPKSVMRSVAPSTYQSEAERENWNPNTGEEDAKRKNLLVLLNKEREAVSNLKAELQRVCIDSRQEKSKLQREIEELTKANTAYYRQFLKEKDTLSQAFAINQQLNRKLESASTQIKTLVNGVMEVIEKLLIMQISPQPMGEDTSFSRKKDPLEEIRELIVQKLERTNTVEGGVNLSEELNKLATLQEKVNMFMKPEKITQKLQTWAANGLEEIQEELWEPTDTAPEYKLQLKNEEKSTRTTTQTAPSERKVSAKTQERDNKVQPVRVEKRSIVGITANLHKGSEVFGPVLSAIEASGIIENNETAEHPSLLRTLENLNVELGNLSLSEDVILSPEKVAAIPTKNQYEGSSNAMKELEELKARILNRRKFATSG